MQKIAILRQELTNLELDINNKALLHCEIARELTEAGRYEEAREAMLGYWERIGVPPKTEKLDDRACAEVLLRAGSLSGWIGSAQQIEGAQEVAKNLLSESLRIFTNLENREKQAEAQVDLGICYWREGDFATARILLDGVIDQLRDSASEQKARACLNNAVVSHSLLNQREALNYLLMGQPVCDSLDNHGLRGRFHAQLAMVYRNLGTEEVRADYLDLALIEFAAASYHFEQIDNQRYEAAIQNNLGELCLETGRFAEAHVHLERARRIANSLKDRFHAAWWDETRARLCLAENQATEAACIARNSMLALQQGDERAYLVQVQTTYAKALVRLNRIDLALANFDEALKTAGEIGESTIEVTIALTMIEEVAEHLHPKRLLELYDLADRDGAQPGNVASLERRRACARRVLTACSAELGIGLNATDDALGLDEKMKRYEKHLIKRALEVEAGQVTATARRLGITYQRLLYQLSTNHRELLPNRIPAKPRRRRLVSEEKTRGLKLSRSRQ